jgi:hypothetical protein
MLSQQHSIRSLLAAVGIVGLTAVALHANYVTPKIGGGQTGGGTAPMKHADVFYSNHQITVVVDGTVATPILRPITSPQEFDPAQPWSVLGYQAYNWQYAFNPGGPISLDPGTKIWVERVYQDPELHVYLRPPQWVYSPETPKWTEIFLADGDRWRWDGAMQHNAYAVCGPRQSVYTATYLVYIGDEFTGEPLPGYGSDTTTWIWNTTQAGDMDCDGDVDYADLGPFVLALLNRAEYEAAFPDCRYDNADGNCDGLVDGADVQAFTESFIQGS